MNLGDTFIWSPDGRREHLYIVVTDPQKNGGNFVVFNLTKSTGGPKALTFRVGHHPYIKRYDSDVNFGDGLIVSLRKVGIEIALHRAIPDQAMDMNLVKQIALFAQGHPAITGDIWQLIKAEWQLT